MTTEECAHIYEHCTLVGCNFTKEAITAAYVAGLAALRAQAEAEMQGPCSRCGYGGKHLDAPPCTTCPAYPQKAEKNDPLTLEELQEMAQAGLAVWCVDTDGTAQGLLCMRENWSDSRIAPHICLLDEECHPGIYSVEYMIEMGAAFYRHKPEEVKTT